VATHYANLTFEVVDAVGSGPVYIGVSGVAALPGIATEPRQIFPRFKKRRPEDGYAVKAFVTSLGLYDFGPLLAGRTPSSRIPVVEEPEDDQGGEEGASPDETLLAPEAPAVQALSPYVLRHAENIRITNDSLFPANVRLGLASAGGDFAVGEDIKGPSPFIVEPDILKLEVQQEAEVKIWCFPPEKGVYKDRIVARIEHNPDPVAFDLNALGEIPGISLDREEVDFGRLMMNIRAEDQKVRIKNESAVAVRWQLLCKDSKSKAAEEAAEGETGEQAGPAVPEEIGVEPKEGQLAPHEEREIRFSFKSTHPAQFKTMLQLEARDAEGLNEWQKAANISVSAESFAVDAVIEPDPREVPLDFGTVLVHTSAQRIFEIVNRGRFPVRYELAIRRALRELLQIDQPKDELQPGERRAITVTCTPGRVFEASSDGIALQIFDQLSGESVDHRIPPMRVALTAVYNTFQVTPPRGLNFGPVEKGETQTRTFTIRNNGIFAFNWSLFDWADPPSIEEGQAPPAKPQVTVGPFTVKPTSGKLDPDDDVQVQVTFQATGDEDYDSKLAVWVDGVQGEASFEAGPAGCSSYLLTGQSCVPGINTTDLQTVFEEQFFTRTLEDAIAIAGRLDVRVFSEADQIFHFGPVLVKERGVGSSQPASPSGAPPDAGVTENLRLTNPKAVPCKVQLSIKQNSDTGAGSSDAFQVFPQELVISPHDSKQIQVKFTPTHLASFGAVLEAVVPQGTDPNSNYLSFELRGDGAVPSVSLQGPRLFGDEGGELDMGKLALFRSNEVQMGLRNDGLLPATVRVDFTPSQHFTVACPSSVSLNKGESRKFQVRFHPHAVGKVVSDLGIRTLGNPFEDVTIQLQGEGHSSEVCWDLAEVRRPGGVFGLRGALEPLQDYVPPSPDELDLGEVPVGELVKVNFKLNNSSSKPLHFDFTSIPSWGEAQVEPSTGYVEPNRQQTITFSFRPADKLQAEKEKILCKVVNVDFLEEEEGAEAGERKHQEVEGTSQQLPLQVSVLADVAKLEPEIEEINFLPTATRWTLRCGAGGCDKNKKAASSLQRWRLLTTPPWGSESWGVAAFVP
ncbi:Hydrocephalus-inducing protein homolog, partial [Durusdinium trenchii]